MYKYINFSAHVQLYWWNNIYLNISFIPSAIKILIQEKNEYLPFFMLLHDVISAASNMSKQHVENFDLNLSSVPDESVLIFFLLNL